MLPFLVAGGVIAGLGKLIYDAVKDDRAPSSSSSSGDSGDGIGQAREKALNELRGGLRTELLSATSVNVSLLLENHNEVVSGKTKASAISMSDLRNLAHMEGRESGFNALKRLTSGLEYSEEHRKNAEWIESASRNRDMLRVLAETL